MPRELNIESVRGRMPVRYRMPVVMRVLGIIAHTLVSGYCIFLMFTRVTHSTPIVMKVLPILILFISLDALFKHLTSLNSIIFTPECLWFRYLILPSIPVDYAQISTMELKRMVTYYVYLGFTDSRGRKRVLKNPASFPKMMEIMYNIADLAPQLQMNPELDKMMSVLRRLKDTQEQVSP